MTALNWASDPSGAWIAVDSLMGDTTGARTAFVSKAHVAAPLRTIIVGTGVTGLVAEWAVIAAVAVVARDARQLGEVAPGVLRTIWAKYAHFGKTATIYHFAMVGEECEVYAFRSTANFACERVPHGIAVKPADASLVIENVPLDLVRAVQEQQRKDRLLPPDEQLHIGGEVILYRLDATGVQVIPALRFEDYEQCWAGMTPGLVPAVG